LGLFDFFNSDNRKKDRVALHASPSSTATAMNYSHACAARAAPSLTAALARMKAEAKGLEN